jgi:hypothetical protein
MNSPILTMSSGAYNSIPEIQVIQNAIDSANRLCAPLDFIRSLEVALKEAKQRNTKPENMEK